MIAHDPKLVLLSSTIAMFGAFTAAVLTSNISLQKGGEGRSRLIMAALCLGGSFWVAQFVGLLAIQAPINLTYKPVFLAGSAAAALFGTLIALFLLRWRYKSDEGRFSLAVTVLGLSIALTNYLSLFAVAGTGFVFSWFIAFLSLAFSIQAAQVVIWFLFKKRGVGATLFGAVALGLLLTAAHYAVIVAAPALEDTLLVLPRDTSGISAQFLAWAATIMMYLGCSICLSVFVIMQFRDDIA
jgi:NO-binding membrane sensor protein with MHYT domain